MRFPIRIQPAWAPLLTVLGMSRASSFAEIDEAAGTLRVKAGIWFDETFPLDQIDDVQPSSWPWYGGLGVKLGPRDAVSVVGSTEGVVAIRFKQKQRMHVLLVVERPELRISVEDPAAFMRALKPGKL